MAGESLITRKQFGAAGQVPNGRVDSTGRRNRTGIAFRILVGA